MPCCALCAYDECDLSAGCTLLSPENKEIPRYVIANVITQVLSDLLAQVSELPIKHPQQLEARKKAAQLVDELRKRKAG